MMDMKRTLLTAAIIGVSLNAQAELLISEVLYDAPNNDSVEEYVELFNNSCQTIDLSGYTIKDNNKVLALVGSVNSGEYYTIAANAGGFSSLFSVDADTTPLVLSLGNSGDYVQLLKNNQVIDQVGWEGGLTGWNLNVRNASIERSNTNLPATQADWFKNSVVGTPGTGNLSTDCGTVPPTPPIDDTQLSKGTAKTNLAASTGNKLTYTAQVPQGAKDLRFSITGSNGDADIYVKYGQAPSNSNYDCRPYIGGSNESCDISNVQVGTYYVEVRAYEGFSDLALQFNYDIDSPVTPPTPIDPDFDFDSYYSQTSNLNGEALKTRLNEIIKDHKRFSYSQVWDQLGYTDVDPNNSNNVILLYTGRSEPKSNRAGQSNSLDAWNREHVWAKSHGFPRSGQHGYTDLHHLRPADVSVNSSRGNKDFAMGGSAIGEAPGTKTDSDSFEPSNDVKGDVARMIFYMDVRYQGSDNSGTPDLSVVEGITSNGQPELGDVCILLKWHQQDPVSAWEQRRNTRIHERQLNRNPFIDNPAWAQSIFGSQCN
ncbi:endonuclease I [Shewanella sp. OPT22]|nr:endonuclease I [Shewanella sp. OPT22]